MESNEMQANGASASEMSAFSRIINVFTSPGKTFASIDLKPGWLLPLLVMVVANLVFMKLAGDVTIQERLNMQEEAMLEQGLDSEQIEQTREMGEKFGMIFGYIFSVIGPFIAVAVVAAVFMFVGNVVLGGKTTFPKLMSVTAHSFLILSLYNLILTPLILAKETALVTFSLASLMPDESATTFLYQLLSRVDVFSFWCIATLSIGLGVIYKMKTQKMATAVVVVYALYALGASALSGLFS
ncbi:MAG: YIP1 family protein [bacterium]